MLITFFAGAMDGVRSIESLAAGDGRHNLYRTLGLALLISMGYIDLGKWVATVDAGSRFGYDLVLLVLLFNLSAILCQYLSICIGMVTGKNLAEICRQEYSQSICVVLGLQAGLSLFTAELTMISGIAVGFNLVFEHYDLITGIIFASVVVNLLPYVVSPLVNLLLTLELPHHKMAACSKTLCSFGILLLLMLGQEDDWNVKCLHSRLCTSLLCAWFISQSTKNSSRYECNVPQVEW